MTNVVLARHGETVWHAENRYTGRTNVPLSDWGREQARLLGRWARRAGLEAVVSSDLSRAIDTALPSAAAIGRRLHTDPRLRELDFGDAEGLTMREIRQRFPESCVAFHDDPAGNPLPAGEEPKAAVERGGAALHDICREHPRGRVLVVAHTTLIRLLLCQLLGIALGEYRRVFPFLRNCGLTELLIRGDRVSLLEYNTPTDNDLDATGGAPASGRR